MGLALSGLRSTELPGFQTISPAHPDSSYTRRAPVIWHFRSAVWSRKGWPGSLRRFRLSSAERKQEHNPSITPEERERLHDLCKRLANEQDPKKFTNLVMELNQLLGSKEVRIEFHEKLK